MRHDELTAKATDAILNKFRTGEWHYGKNLGKNLSKCFCSHSFPSPDAAFYDSDSKFLIQFEFKPPTETKRGMLTGVGQALAYLNNSDISYLISPRNLGDYEIGAFLENLFKSQIQNKLRCGLILYENDHPENVDLKINVKIDKSLKPIKKGKNYITTDRFWAKHQDLPVEMFHLILHYYYLKKVHIINENEDAFAKCFLEKMVPEYVIDTKEPAPEILDCSGKPIKTLTKSDNLTFLKGKLANYKKSNLDLNIIEDEIIKIRDVETKGDNYYNSWRKNYLTFMKHVGVITSTEIGKGEITELGLKIYNLGILNEPSSALFYDYFTRLVLIEGHHLDLIIDMQMYYNKYPNKGKKEIRSIMESDYETSGKIKRNPNRSRKNNQKEFLEHERTLWRALHIMDTDDNFDWGKITYICSLPDL